MSPARLRSASCRGIWMRVSGRRLELRLDADDSSLDRAAFLRRLAHLHGLTMARPRPPEFDKKKIVAENRRARFEYFLEDFFEAGIALTGTEVKSLRFGEGS